MARQLEHVASNDARGCSAAVAHPRCSGADAHIWGQEASKRTLFLCSWREEVGKGNSQLAEHLVKKLEGNSVWKQNHNGINSVGRLFFEEKGAEKKWLWCQEQRA